MNKEIKTLGDAWKVLDSIGLKYSKGSSDCFENAEIIQNILDLNADLLAACEDCDKAFVSWQLGQIPGRPEDILALINKVRAAIAAARGEK